MAASVGVFSLFRSYDEIHKAESLADDMRRDIGIPPFMADDVIRLDDICLRCVNTMLDSVRKLFDDYTHAATGYAIFCGPAW